MSENEQNLLFIVPDFFFIEEYQKLLYYNNIPLGTLQISSFLRERKKIKTQIIDLRVEREKYQDLAVVKPNDNGFKDAFLKVLEKNNIQEFQNVGINCYTSLQFLYTDYIAKILKEEFPNINIIVGGYHSSAVPEDFNYKNSPFDFIVRGEAENMLLELFNSNKLSKPSERKNSEILESTRLADVNTLPFPDYELYLHQYPYKNKFSFDFYMSRGCPYQCAFCAKNYEFRSYSFKNFRDHFEKLCNVAETYNPKNTKISFADQSINKVLIIDNVVKYIKERELQERFKFSCQSRVEIISENPKLVKDLRNCGMVIGYGFESANNKLLIEMHKTQNPLKYIEDMKNILKEYRDGEWPYCRLNLLCGFPGETQETFDETINFLKENALHMNIQISPSLFENYPNVYVYPNMKYYENKYGSEFLKEWWKIPSNSFKNSVPEKPSKSYSKKQLIKDYKDKYISLLKEFRHDTFAHLIVWKQFFNKWYNEL